MDTLGESILNAWRINCRATAFLVERLPRELWPLALAGASRRSVRSLAVHLHDCRCLWVASLGKRSGVTVPSRLGRGAATQEDVSAALGVSGGAVLRLLRGGLKNGGAFPGVSSAFVYGAMPRDVALFSGYALAHEAHHRGQIVLMARELGHRLPQATVGGLWQWSSRLREAPGEVPGHDDELEE